MSIFLTEKLNEVLPKFKTILESEYLKQPFSKVEPKLLEICKIIKQKGLWNPYLSQNYGGLDFNCNAPDIGNRRVDKKIL